MSTNLLATSRKKRACAMKTLLIPSAALTTLKKVACALFFCCAVLMVPANLRAEIAYSDPCTNPTVGTTALPVGSATGCGVIITIPPSGPATITVPAGTGNPYDGDEDTLVGIVNNSGAPISSITLTSTANIFAFDGDGPCDYAQFISPALGSTADCLNYPAGVPNNTNPGADPYDYQGPDNTFSNYASLTSGTVNFVTPLPNGGSTWFALEGTPSSVSVVTVSYTLAVTLTGMGAGTVTDTSNTSSPPPTPIDCTEAGGGVPQTGVCSEIDTSGATVTLTENPGTTSAGVSIFGGWGGACASYGTMPTCTVTVNSSQTATASFIAPPSTNPVVPSTCSATNVTGTVNYCPNNPNPITPENPCTDPNGVQFSVSIPVVSPPTQGEACLALSVTATEVKGDGLCPANETGQSGDFDCRFVNFYNYGTDPATGSTVTPLCYPYSNGDCIFYTLALTGGGVPNPELYSGGVYWQVAFNSVVTPPQNSYWSNSSPNLLDDPDEDEIPPLPWGTDCNTPMTDDPGGPSGTYYCQFDNNITTFYQPSTGSFDPIGGKTQQTNDVVVAFLPTSTGTNPPQQPPTPTAPAIAGNCVNGCVVSGTSITFTEGTGGTFRVSATAGYPAPTLSQTGALPNGLTFNAETGLVSGTPADGAAGNYPITFSASNGVGSPATLSYILTVSPAALTITASSATMTYGGTVPTISVLNITGLVNGDTASSLGTITCTTTATSSSPVGSYPSSCSATDPTYTITSVPGSVTVGQAPLTITASSATMTYGGTVPTITPSFTGLVNGDNATTLGVTCTTTATSASLPGSYPSSCTASRGGNYKINYVGGTVTVVGLEISPSTVNFGTLYLDLFGFQSVVLTNTTSAPITITSITVGGGTAPLDYGDISFCPPMIFSLPATLPAGKTCAIGVGILATTQVFSPTASTTTLTITDSAASQSVQLTAQVINPQASFSSTYLSFGKLTFPTTEIGKSNQQTITVTNPGNTPLTIVGTPAISSSSGDFVLTSTTCTNATINTTAEGGTKSCVMNVTFTPKSSGNFTGTLKITDNALFNPQTITLSGNGSH